MLKADRVEWLDIGRGIGIILVVLGHCFTTIIRENSSLVMLMYELIFFVHMPFWFYLSGYGYKISEARYKKMDFKYFIMNKAKTLLIPYVSYSALIFIIFYCCSQISFTAGLMNSVGYGQINFFHWLKGLLVGDNLFSLHLWYIYVLFFFLILTFLLTKITHNKYFLLVISIVFLIYLYTLGTGPFIAGIPNFLYFYFWYAVAITLPLDRISFKFSLLSIIIAALFFSYSYKFGFNVINNIYINSIVLLVMKGLAVIGLIGLTKAISIRSNKLLKYLGRNSFSIYLFHQPFIGSILGNVLHVYFNLPIIIVVPITFTLALALPLLFTQLLKRTTKVKFLFGIKN